MRTLNTLWRMFYGIAIIGIAVLQLVKASFMPVIIPSSVPYIATSITCVWMAGVLLISAGVLSMGFSKYSRMAALGLGAFLLLLFLTLHLPYQLKTNLHFLAGWSDALKILALCGGVLWLPVH